MCLVGKINEVVRQEYGDKVVDIFVFSETENDFDVALIVSDEVNKVHIIEKLSRHLVKLSVDIGKFITITPLWISEFKKKRNFFIKNIIDERMR